MARRRSYRRKTIPWFSKSGWGTVYLMQSMSDPELFKVGFTRRKTKDRRAELRSKVHGELKIVYGVSMHHAYIAEQNALKGLRRRFLGRGDPRGTEWFRLRKFETIGSIKYRMDKSARRTRIIATLKLSWPILGQVKVFNPKINYAKMGKHHKHYATH